VWGEEVYSNADVRLDFSKFLVCLHKQAEGVEPVWIFFGQGEEKKVTFLRFFADVIHGRPLTNCLFCVYKI